MAAIDKATLLECLDLILRPIAKFCLRHRLSLQEIQEVLRRTIVAAAAEELSSNSQKPSINRIAAMTGIHRREVSRIHLGTQAKPFQPTLALRLIGQWQTDKRFRTKSKGARVLSIDGADSDFYELVRSVGSDLHPTTVLKELELQGLVKHTRGGIKLARLTYNTGKDARESYAFIGDDIEDLLQATEDNVFNYATRPHLHIKTVYDNIAREDIPPIRSWLLKEGARFHSRLRRFLAERDLDITPRGSGVGGARVAIGTFSRISLPGEDLGIELTTAQDANSSPNKGEDRDQ